MRLGGVDIPSDIVLVGPHRAFLVQGDDHLGALAEIHRRLFEGNINVYASSGVTESAPRPMMS